MTNPEPHALYSLTVLYGAEHVVGSPYVFLSDGELLDSDNNFINKDLYAFPEEPMARCKDETTYSAYDFEAYNPNHENETRYDLVPVNDPNPENEVRYELVPVNDTNVKNEAQYDGEQDYDLYAESEARHDGEPVRDEATKIT